MTGWKITIFNRGCIFKWLFCHCHVTFGRVSQGNLLAMWIYSKVPQLLQRGGWPLVLRCLAATHGVVEDGKKTPRLNNNPS